MEIIGKYDGGFDNKHDCKIKIEKGIIGVYTYNDTKKEDLIQPQKDIDWKLDKINWKEPKIVKAKNNNIFNPNIRGVYSHKITYKTKHGDTHRIFINPTKDEIIEINSQQKKYWIFQPKYQKQISIAIISALLAIIVGIIISIILKNT